MNIAICGRGRMGSLIAQTAVEQGNTVVQGDALEPGILEQAKENMDVLIDFSHPDSLEYILETIKGTPTPLVLGTTGYSDKQIERIHQEAKVRPVFFASNYSVGVAVLQQLARQAAQMLENWDKEIVEAHHRKKVDAPSGTALSLLEAIDPGNEYKHVFGREGHPGERGKEIGIHAVRGGSVPGDHEVLFLGEQETITLAHHAQNREIFVHGALDAARFIQNKPAGLYGMPDLIGEKQ